MHLTRRALLGATGATCLLPTSALASSDRVVVARAYRNWRVQESYPTEVEFDRDAVKQIEGVWSWLIDPRVRAPKVARFTTDYLTLRFNNGGRRDYSTWTGVELRVYATPGTVVVTDLTTNPRQVPNSSHVARAMVPIDTAGWHAVRLPFSAFKSRHAGQTALENLTHLEVDANDHLAVAEVAMYRA